MIVVPADHLALWHLSGYLHVLLSAFSILIFCWGRGRDNYEFWHLLWSVLGLACWTYPCTASWSSHVESQEDECEVSGSKFTDDDGETNHLISHGINSRYHCHKCDMKLKNKRQLMVHTKCMHAGQPVNSNITCDERSPKVNSIQIHQRTHTRSDKFWCMVRGKRFKRSKQVWSPVKPPSQPWIILNIWLL